MNGEETCGGVSNALVELRPTDPEASANARERELQRACSTRKGRVVHCMLTSSRPETPFVSTNHYEG